jgi:hypothetical protein
MTGLFDVDGENLHPGYKNLREGKFPAERAISSELNRMWEAYAPYADPDFPDGFARDPDSRFWEMYIGCSLLAAKKQLLPTKDRLLKGGQPDICVVDGDKRLWIEAIAPDRGAPGPDHVPSPKPLNEGGGLSPVPVRQAQLRVTSALWTKSQALTRYLNEGVIKKNDVRLVAIGGGRFGIHVPDNELPLILSAVFPIGPEYVTIDKASGEVVDQGFEASLTIAREGGTIPRTAFLDGPFVHVSGVLWSRVSIGNMSANQRPLTFVHNPRGEVTMPQNWGVWNREFVASEADGKWTATDILGKPKAAS